MTTRAAIAWSVILLLIPSAARADDTGISTISDIIEWDSVVGRVSFPHLLHVEDLGIDCADCHHETNAARLDMPHPQYLEDFWINCQSCHAANADPTVPQACSTCHHASPITIADETLSSKVVIHRSCWSCHEITTGAEASAGCASCHQRSLDERDDGSQS